MRRIIVCLVAVVFMVGCGATYTTQDANQSSDIAVSNNIGDKQKALKDRIDKIPIGESREVILKEWGEPAESKVDKTVNSQVITTDCYRFGDEKMVWSFVYSNGVLDGKYLVQDTK